MSIVMPQFDFLRDSILKAVPASREFAVLPDIARLRITLDHVTPRVLRVIEVPLGIRLADLHLAFQIALGWENYHLYEFRIPGAAWGIPDPDGHVRGDPFSARTATLAKLLAKAGENSFRYA